MFARPASPFKQMLSRPGSPDRQARSPSQIHSPDRIGSPSRQRWLGSINGHGGLAAHGSVRTRSGMSVASHSDSGKASLSSDASASLYGRASPAPPASRTPSLREPDQDLSPSTTAGASPFSPRALAISQAEHFDVVLESEKDQIILPYLGDVVLDLSDVHGKVSDDALSASASASSIQPVVAATNDATSSYCEDLFDSTLDELVETERNYVRRMDILYRRFALPLRQMAQDRDTAILPKYEAQRLFGNIGEIVGANMAFLHELEAFLAARVDISADASELAELLYRNLACLACYNEYLANYEKANHIEHAMIRANRGFRDFVERTKSDIQDLGNIGLRELLMDPVQRIPRYILLMHGLRKSLPSHDNARGRLDQAIKLASQIARCEVDEKTKSAAVLWSLSRNIEGFPPSLFSSTRRLIDCIDVDDYPLENVNTAAKNPLLSPASSFSNQLGPRILRCAFLLFDDVVVIAKRAHGSTCSRDVLGLDNLNTLADQMKTATEKSSSAVARSPVRSELSFRGLIDLCDVHVSDLGGADFQINMSVAPLHVSGDKWASRLMRQCAAVDVKGRNAPHQLTARKDKKRFVESVWQRQALCKAIDGHSHARLSITPAHVDDGKVRRLTYWRIYDDRKSYEQEHKKPHAVLHVDLRCCGDALGTMETDRSRIVLRMLRVDEDGGMCVISRQTHDSPFDSDHQQTVSLNDLARLLREEVRPDSESYDFCVQRCSPSTPGSSQRNRNNGGGLEQFGRSLFGTSGSMRSSTVGSDIFGVRRALSNRSTQNSRNASTSTRTTYSSANTSSVGSRDMMGKSLASPLLRTDVKVLSEIARYRNTSPSQGHPPERIDSPDILPSSPSPVRRKAVCTIVEEPAANRDVSNSSKRGVDSVSSPSHHPSKRSAIERDNARQRQSVDQNHNTLLPIRAGNSEHTPHRHHHATEGTLPLADSVVPRTDPGDKDLPAEPRMLEKTDKEVAKEMGSAGIAPSAAVQQVGKEVQKDLDFVRAAAENTHEALKRLLERMNERGRAEVSGCLVQLDDSLLAHGRIQSAVAALLAAAIQNSAGRSEDEAAFVKRSELLKLQTQMAALLHKCDTLAELEKDGRLENTALHKAFNEELDRLYDEANLGEIEQIAAMRSELKQAKAWQHEATAEVSSLKKTLALEKAQSEVWRATLAKHGLL